MSLKRKHFSPSHVIFLALFVSILIGLPNLIQNTSRGIKVTGGFTKSGVWNGFNDHQIVVECYNSSDKKEDLSITPKDPLNIELGTEIFSIPPHGTSHLLLNKFSIVNNYGSFELAGSSGDSSHISCNTITYRMDSDGDVQYATSMTVGETVKGRMGGVYNSMSPDSGPAVYNWLSVIKPGEGQFAANVIVRDQEGKEIPQHNFRIENLNQGQRLDTALGHPWGQVVGTYEIIPDDPDAEYMAFLSRYSEVAPGEYNFSMILLASKGYADSGIVPASTMGPAINWGEISNISAFATNVLIEIFNRDGQIIHSEEKTIDSYSQYHVYLNQYIGELNVGYFRVHALNNKEASLIVQSLYYGHEADDSKHIAWAYNSSAAGGEFVNTASFSINTNLKAPNWLKVFRENSSTPMSLLLELYDSAGNLVLLGEKEKLSFLGSSDFPVHELVGPDFVGNLKVISENDQQKFQGQLVRVFISGGNATNKAMAARSMKELSGRKGIGSSMGAVLAIATKTSRKGDETKKVNVCPPKDSPERSLLCDIDNGFVACCNPTTQYCGVKDEFAGSVMYPKPTCCKKLEPCPAGTRFNGTKVEDGCIVNICDPVVKCPPNGFPEYTLTCQGSVPEPWLQHLAGPPQCCNPSISKCGAVEEFVGSVHYFRQICCPKEPPECPIGTIHTGLEIKNGCEVRICKPPSPTPTPSFSSPSTPSPYRTPSPTDTRVPTISPSTTPIRSPTP